MEKAKFVSKDILIIELEDILRRINNIDPINYYSYIIISKDEQEEIIKKNKGEII